MVEQWTLQGVFLLYNLKGWCMSNVQIFNFNGSTVRTFDFGDDVWFLAKDVAYILEIENVSQALSRLDEDEKNTIILNEGIGNPEKSIVNESGIYNLVFSSRKPEAKLFKKWVTSEVLPAIRKTGGYIVTKEDDTPEAILARAVLVANDTITRLNEQKKLAEQERDIAIATKAQISDRKTATAMATASKLSKENTKLKEELGKSKTNATIIAVENKTKNKNTYNWRPLTRYCKDHKLAVLKVNDDRYGEVNSYPAEAWNAIYGVNIEGIF